VQPPGYRLRPARPQDYDAIASVVDEWWGRPLMAGLPRLFLDHFHPTSLVAEDADGRLAGFLVGFVSPGRPGEAYVHYAAVGPPARGGGLGRALYERFFGLARDAGCTTVRAVTGPVNVGSMAFHRAIGFTVGDPVADYDGPGRDLVPMSRTL